MCGIAGKVFCDREQRVDEHLLRAMCQRMVHRGPDDEGYYLEGHVGLGMRRLQVIDLEGGHQPMSNEDGSLWIVFNGEIYNYQTLRRELEDQGHAFRTASDTETILHLYEEKGLDCLQDLRGMFAFAIWDVRQEELFLARDRLGQKPLYYALYPDSLIFGSEIGVLLEDPALKRDIDYVAIDEYLTYLFIPCPRSIFKDIRKLPPASYAVYARGKLRIESYWSVQYHLDGPTQSEAEYLEQLQALLQESVRLRMISDVPVGAFLSGGLDSSLIATLMHRFSGQSVKTFSIGFEEASFNELNYARLVAEKLGTDHREYLVDYKVQDLLPLFVEHFGEPFADSSALPVYHLSRMTRQEVTVALSGDGADEIFGGYRRYQARRLVEWFNRWPGWAGRRGLELIAESLPEPAVYYGQSLRKKMKRLVEYAAAVREDPNTSWAFFWTGKEKTSLYSENFADIIHNADPVIERREPLAGAGKDPVNQMLLADLKVYLPDDILVKVDRMSMACSLEVRSPFLDHKLVEFMATVPLELKVSRWCRKYLLRRMGDELLPEQIVKRPKQGFAVPVAAWFRGELRDWVRDMLLSADARERGFFRPEAVEKMLSMHARQRDLSQQLWALVILEIWHRTVLSRP